MEKHNRKESDLFHLVQSADGSTLHYAHLFIQSCYGTDSDMQRLFVAYREAPSFEQVNLKKHLPERADYREMRLNLYTVIHVARIFSRIHRGNLSLHLSLTLIEQYYRGDCPDYAFARIEALRIDEEAKGNITNAIYIVKEEIAMRLENGGHKYLRELPALEATLRRLKIADLPPDLQSKLTEPAATNHLPLACPACFRPLGFGLAEGCVC